jgi:hypothetical protein
METTARGIVYIGASNETSWGEDDTLEKQEFQAMKDIPNCRVADAVEFGLVQVHAKHPASAKYYFSVYQCFGDPTVSLFKEASLAILTPSALPFASVGEPYSVTLTAAGGVEPYGWSLLHGGLPDGLSLDASGVISGSATQSGQYEFQVKVVDSSQPQQMDARTFRLKAPEPPALETSAGGWKEVSDPLMLRVLVDDAYGPVTYQWVKDGIDLSDKTSNTLDIEALALNDEGWYSCRVTDEAERTYETVPVFVRVFPQGALPAAGLTGLCIVALACGLAAIRAVSRKRC